MSSTRLGLDERLRNSVRGNRNQLCAPQLSKSLTSIHGPDASHPASSPLNSSYPGTSRHFNGAPTRNGSFDSVLADVQRSPSCPSPLLNTITTTSSPPKPLITSSVGTRPIVSSTLHQPHPPPGVNSRPKQLSIGEFSHGKKPGPETTLLPSHHTTEPLDPREKDRQNRLAREAWLANKKEQELLAKKEAAKKEVSETSLPRKSSAHPSSRNSFSSPQPPPRSRLSLSTASERPPSHKGSGTPVKLPPLKSILKKYSSLPSLELNTSISALKSTSRSRSDSSPDVVDTMAPPRKKHSVHFFESDLDEDSDDEHIGSKSLDCLRSAKEGSPLKKRSDRLKLEEEAYPRSMSLDS